MCALISLWILLCLGHTFALNNVYLPASSNQPRRSLFATEYFSYIAPLEDDQSIQLQAAQQLANAITPPQQVVFIRTPETNIFSLTAKQLAFQNPLDIYVFHRKLDAGTLAQQKAEIEEQEGHKPRVHFVKYRTPADVSRALSSLKSNYDQLPGRSYIHDVETAQVIKLNTQQQQPVVSKSLPQTSGESGTHELANELEAAKLQALFRQYLPPHRR